MPRKKIDATNNQDRNIKEEMENLTLDTAYIYKGETYLPGEEDSLSDEARLAIWKRMAEKGKVSQKDGDIEQDEVITEVIKEVHTSAKRKKNKEN